MVLFSCLGVQRFDVGSQNDDSAAACEASRSPKTSRDDGRLTGTSPSQHWLLLDL